MEMSPRERIIATLRGEIPDRVPVMEMAVDWKVMRGLGYRSYWKMIEEMDPDAVPVNQILYLMGLRGPLIRAFKHYRDEWGIGYRYTGELLPVPTDHPIHTVEDLRSHPYPDPGKSPLLKAIGYARRRFPDRALIVLHRSDFAASWYLCGMERLLTSYIEEPGFAEELGARILAYSREFVGLAVEAGVDIVALTDDYAYKGGCIMSPGQFRSFILPNLTETAAAVHAAGGLCMKHTDGNIEEIIDDIAGCGVDAIGPLEPGAGMDLAAVKARFGGRVTVVGNVDVDLLSRGTEQAVADSVRDLIRRTAPGGRYILSSGNTISSSVDPENFRIMVRTARECGGY